jgi:hypothetical protein
LESIDYNDTMRGTAYATSAEEIQYDTVIFDIPAAEL